MVKGLGFLRTGCDVSVPLTRAPSEDEATGLASLGIVSDVIEAEFPVIEIRPRSISEYLDGRLPPQLLSKVPKSYDVVGDIAIMELPTVLQRHKALIGEAAMRVNGGLRLVLDKTEDISGLFRVGEYEVMAGRGSAETTHREWGCAYRLDPTKVFFTPRLSTERSRVASKVGSGEVIGDLFAGVGPFSILIAKRAPGVRVYAIDINPHAFRYLEENIKLNGVGDKVFAIAGDAADIAVGRLKGVCNRVIMNLPAGAELFLGAASSALGREGGIVHLHIFAEGLESLGERASNIARKFIDIGWGKVNIIEKRTIREVGARSYHVAIDIVLIPVGDKST